METIILVKNLKHTMGISCWMTDDVSDDESGVSGAGYESVQEAVSDAVGNIECHDGIYVVDATGMGDEILHLSSEQLYAMVHQNKVPLAEWKSNHDLSDY